MFDLVVGALLLSNRLLLGTVAASSSFATRTVGACRLVNVVDDLGAGELAEEGHDLGVASVGGHGRTPASAARATTSRMSLGAHRASR
ncbi:MAG: hypothetical protein M5U31_16325 [Acidimicrobiia bacterium]|nr:hypothetical protein [Acidimicrobiia bacterium]